MQATPGGPPSGPFFARADIGIVTRTEDGAFNGSIRTLSLNVKARFVQNRAVLERKGFGALASSLAPSRISAAWQRTSKDNTVDHSVKLDDPSFPTPIFANQVEVEGSYALVWSR